MLEKLAQKIIEAYEKDNVCETPATFEVPNSDAFAPAPTEIKLHTVMSEDVCSTVFIKSGELPVLAPFEYTKAEVGKLLSTLDLGADEVALKLPPLASGRDMEIINKLLSDLPVKTLIAENIYGLSYAARGYRVIAGAGMNIANNFAAREAIRLGAYAVVPSLEFKDGIRDASRTSAEEGVGREEEGEYSGDASGQMGGHYEEKSHMCDDFYAPVRVFASDYRYPLMTLAHCPYKTLFGNDCAHCSYRPGLTLSRERHTYCVRRVRLSRCIFELYADD